MENDFDRWNRIKKATDAADEAARLYFREGEIWWVRLGKNIGYETDGKSREFTRPVIILKKNACWSPDRRTRHAASAEDSPASYKIHRARCSGHRPHLLFC